MLNKNKIKAHKEYFTVKGIKAADLIASYQAYAISVNVKASKAQEGFTWAVGTVSNYEQSRHYGALNNARAHTTGVYSNLVDLITRCEMLIVKMHAYDACPDYPDFSLSDVEMQMQAITFVHGYASALKASILPLIKKVAEYDKEHKAGTEWYDSLMANGYC